jgi:hypothetical protein
MRTKIILLALASLLSPAAQASLKTKIRNADVAASAAIAVNKLQALTASRACSLDGSGFLAASTATATEQDFLSGVTSSLCGINQSCTLSSKTIATPTVTGVATFAAGSSGAPSIAFTGATTSGLYGKSNAVAFAANGTFAGEALYTGNANSAVEWFLGANLFTNNQHSPLVLQSTNYQLTLKGSTDTNAKTWYFDVDAAGGGTFQINSTSSGETGLVSPASTLYWGAGGTPPTRLSVVSNSTVTTSPTLGGNTRSVLSAKNTDSTAGNYEGLNAYAANGLVGMAAWVNDVQTAAAMDSHFELGVASAGTISTRFKLLKTGQPVFSFFSTAGPVITSSSGVLTAPGWCSAIIAGSGITCTDNGNGTVTLATSGAAAANYTTISASTGSTSSSSNDVFLDPATAGGTITVTLHTAVGNGGQHMNFKCISGGTINLTGRTVEGDSAGMQFMCNAGNLQNFTLGSDNSNWWVL